MIQVAAPFTPVMFRSLWAYRGFVLGSVRREFQVRYLGSLLGSVWAVLNPLAMIVVFTLIFSEIMGARMPGPAAGAWDYSIYLCAGLLPWGLFSEQVLRLNNVFIEHGNLIKKANFPRICLPSIVAVSSLVNFAIVMVLFFAFLVLVGQLPGAPLAALPLILAVQVALALGLGVLLGTLNVFFRDIGQLTGVVMQFWFWLTPIVYVAQIVPEGMRGLLRLNPMLPVVEAYQSVFSRHEVPDWTALAYPILLAVVLMVVGGLAFLRLSGEIADEL